MRRGISILLALLFGVGPLLSTLPGSEDARLPACCRRHGAHRCAMAQMAAMAGAPDGKTSVTAPPTCPYYPGSTLAVLMPAYALTAEAQPLPQLKTRSRAPVPSDQADLQGPNLTHAGRGPPPSFPS